MRLKPVSFGLASILVSLSGTSFGQSIEEIVVTAQKREQSINDVALSVSVMTGDKIVEQGFNDLQEVSTFTPGLLVEQGDTTGSSISVRGINNGGPNVAFEQAVAVFNDGIYNGRSLQSVAGIYDIAQVEVLFGPQPVYFGQSAIAGLVSYKSNRPSDELEGYVVAEYGSYDSRKLEGAISGPLSENWSYRVAGKITESDGWTTVFATGEEGNASEDTALRLSLSGDLTDSLSVYLKTEMFEQETSGAPFPTISCNPSLGIVGPGGPIGICGNLTDEVNYGYNEFINKGSTISATELPGPMSATNLDLTGLDIASNDALGLDVEGDNSLVEFKWDISDELIFTSLTGYSEYESTAIEDFDSSPYAAVLIENSEEFEMISQEFRLQSDLDGAFNWMAGLYYQDQELDFLNRSTLGIRTRFGPPESYVSGDYHEDATYLGAFATALYDINDRLSLDIGVRWSNVEKSAYLLESAGGLIYDNGGTPIGLTPVDDTQLRAGGRCLGNTPGNLDCDAVIVATEGQAVLDAMGGNTDLELDDSDVNYQVSLTYDVNDQVSTFARFVTGFKAGGFSRGGSSFGIATKGAYDAEEAESFEFGLRYGDDNLRTNITLFHTSYENRQVEAFFDDGVDRQLIFVNAAEATVQGFEADALYISSFGTRFNAGISYTDSEYDSYENAGCLPIERGQAALMIAGSPDCVNGEIDLSGTSFDGVPDWNIILGVSHDFEISDDLLLTLGADASIFDDFDDSRGQSDAFSYDYRDQDGFTLVNVRAALRSLDAGWEVALYGRNVTDETYWLTQPTGENPYGTTTAGYSRPASYGIQFRYDL